MTEEYKELLISKMIDAPFSLSDDDLRLIQEDEELRDICELSSSLCTASQPEPEFDMDAEWASFHGRLLRKRKLFYRIALPLAAAAAAAVLLFGFLFSTSDDMSVSHPAPLLALTEQPVVVVAEAVKVDSVAQPPAPAPKVTPQQPKRPAAPNPEPEVDVDEFLRIEQARIDNDIAVQVAEVVSDEYQAMLMAQNIDPDATVGILKNTIEIITIQ